jgi:hypothetical protein
MRPNFRLLPRLLSLPNSVFFLVCLLPNSVIFLVCLLLNSVIFLVCLLLNSVCFFFVLLLLDSVFFLVLVLANSEPISCVGTFVPLPAIPDHPKDMLLPTAGVGHGQTTISGMPACLVPTDD